VNEQEREVLRILVSESVAEALRNADKNHCNLTPEQKLELGHLMGLLRDIGDGDIAAGIEVLRSMVKLAPAEERQENHKFVSAWRQGTHCVKTSAIKAVVAVVIPGILFLIWMAVTGRAPK
jgi:hypothetical protein